MVKGKIKPPLLVLLLIAIFTGFAGCDSQEETPTLTLNNMDFTLADADNIEIHAFQLGEGDLRNLIGNPVAAPLSGIIALPSTEEPSPLVVIFHGNARVRSVRERIYSGFDYLAQQLAAEGYAVISINVLVNYSFEMGESSYTNEWAHALFDYHIALLEQANAGQDVGHGVDLTGRLDLNQIHLIGHSRGGEITDSLVRRDRAVGLERIRSRIMIASTVIFYQEWDGEHHPDIPTGIIIPEFDDDVINNEGHIVFDEILALGQNRSMVSLVYLRGGNHNFFNRMVEIDDRVDSFQTAAELSPETWLAREQQEDFLMRYAAAFLAVVTGNREPWGTFNTLESQPVTMFGYAVTASTYVPLQRVFPIPSEDMSNVSVTGSATANFYSQSFFMEDSGVFSHPAVLARQYTMLPLYALEWNDGGSVSFVPLSSDFTAHNALSLYVAVYSANELNPQGAYQSFTVALTDSSSNRQSVVIPTGIGALAFHVGELFHVDIFGTIYDDWLGHMPLGELRIPLAYFNGIDLLAVSEISIVFDQVQSGAVMLSGIYLK